MVVVDKSAPASILEYSWMDVANLFGVGKAAMIMTHTVDANRFQNPDNAPAGRDLNIMYAFFMPLLT
jgi:ABC-type glycerol-3-phosphate transport system substrate-binding protein